MTVARRTSSRIRRESTPIFLVLPMMAVLIFVTSYPLLRTVFMSFHKFTLTSLETGSPFIGLKNFYELVYHDPRFRTVVINTVYFSSGTISLQLIIGLVMALLLNEEIMFKRFFRGVLLTPWIIPSVTASLLWTWIYNARFGVLNCVLKALGIIGSFREWLQNPDLAMPCVILAETWKSFPFVMLMLLAGLQAVPEEMYDAAKVDGADAIQRFRHITLPFLKPLIATVIVLSYIWEFGNFTLIWILTRGGPMFLTTTFSIFIYKLAFEDYTFGYAAASGILYLAFLLAFTVIYIKVLGKEREIR